MADDKKIVTDEDKSINDLLEEYAADVKDKDIDDFLKESDDENPFDSEEDAAEEESEKVLAEQGEPRRKGSGLLTMVFIIVAFGAAGAGAYMYLNRDEGMTSMMGGIMGGNDNAQVADMSGPAPVLDSAAPQPSMPEAPTPIMNDQAAATPGAPMLTAPDMPTPPPADAIPAPTADVVTLPAPGDATASATPTATTTPADATAASSGAAMAPAPTPAADAAAAQQAVDAWTSGTVTPAMPGPDGAGNTTPVLPEQEVGEMKAKPPVTKKAKPAEPVKAETAAASLAPTPAEPAVTPAAEMPKPEPVKTAEPAAPEPARKKKAPAKTASAKSGMDGALPPPYLEIQAGKSPAAATGMAPVVEARGTTSGTAGHRDLEGRTNKNVADVSAATGQTAAMVAQGGGMIDLGTTVIQPSGASTASAQTMSGGVPVVVARDGDVPAPITSARPVMPSSSGSVPMRTVPLAINGGRSMPAGAMQTQEYAQLPDTTQGTKPAGMPAMPVEPVTASRSMEAPATPRAPAAAPAASASGNNAQAIVSQALAAEKSGDKAGALALFQKALEVDAVYGDGKSIDRGMVYDHIGGLQ